MSRELLTLLLYDMFVKHVRKVLTGQRASFMFVFVFMFMFIFMFMFMFMFMLCMCMCMCNSDEGYALCKAVKPNVKPAFFLLITRITRSGFHASSEATSSFAAPLARTK